MILYNYNKNPVVLWAHQYDSPPIGKALSINLKGKKTIARVLFADAETYEFADTIYRLAKGGFLNTVSVGFIPMEWEDGDGEKVPRRTYTKQELLEFSIVPVPSNPEALVSAREAGIITVKEFDFVTKPEETEDYFRVPMPGESGKHDGHRIRTIDISEKEGIKALYCGEDKVVITYLFSKDEKFDWTMDKAKAWVKEHEKAVHQPRVTSQDELKDELEYVLSLIKLVGIADHVKDTAITISEEIRRLTGSDIPENIESPKKSSVAHILKALADYHEVHKKHIKFCKDALEEIDNGCELPTGEVPMNNGDKDKEFIREVVNQILSKRRN